MQIDSLQIKRIIGIEAYAYHYTRTTFKEGELVYIDVSDGVDSTGQVNPSYEETLQNHLNMFTHNYNIRKFVLYCPKSGTLKEILNYTEYKNAMLWVPAGDLVNLMLDTMTSRLVDQDTIEYYDDNHPNSGILPGAEHSFVGTGKMVAKADHGHRLTGEAVEKALGWDGTNYSAKVGQERLRRTHVGTIEPSNTLGSEGDIYIQYKAD